MKKLILAAIGLFFASSAFAVAPLIGDVADQNIAQGAGILYLTIDDTETTFIIAHDGTVTRDPVLLLTFTLGGSGWRCATSAWKCKATGSCS